MILEIIAVIVYLLIGSRFCGFKHGSMTKDELCDLWNFDPVHGPLCYLIWTILWPLVMFYNQGRNKAINERIYQQKLLALDRELQQEISEIRQERLTCSAEEWVKSNG
ncbi:MAG: hypothetical protein UT24_C0030G0016 [Candidatus Woesebacteria bacterium GW2011_GWB1_39_12]|uniref:Uncharacterized protein n=1 Tax=Candidatus Woesebacteria bacterium GW2011_GWB1_39_12 TaxID=1618574 RepID=A0A0G0M441_9BACT|nr:MAG: hypothetical protein UT24_C0030G0016 [Candidatus Woesebacteria bacterium GW2011_GWB1_39_12]